MRVRVDAARCVGHGLCYGRAPEVFTDDDEGYSHARFGGELPAELENSARLAASNCPERAIEVS
jgi:ferredoxin